MKDKLFCITGGTSGIGLETAKKLAGEGAKLALLGRQEERLKLAIAQLPGNGHRLAVCDFASEEDVAKAIDQIRKDFSIPFSGAVFCAGSHMMRPYNLTKISHYRDMFSANFESAMICLRPLVKHSAPAENGASFVVVSSIAAIRGGAGTIAYSAAKGALNSAIRVLALELAAKKIRVNSVLPGVVQTEMTNKFFETLNQTQKESIISSHPLGLGLSIDIANAIRFLLSDDSRWITGTELIIDGGLSCRS